MHNFIDRVGRAPLAIVAGSLVIGAGILGVHAAASDNSGLDNTSAEYQEGWNRAVKFNLPDSQGLSGSRDLCTLGIRYEKDPDPNTEGDVVVSFFGHWEYDQHQREEWAHGCLDAIRNLSDYKVPQQSWEG
jgi:hypothetical protein